MPNKIFNFFKCFIMVDYIFFRLQITIKKNFLYAPEFERTIYDDLLNKNCNF